MKRIISVFLLSGILISITCCTKEAVRKPQTITLSPQEAYMLLAKHIKSTEDDVIYLDMTFEQAKKMGITEKLYRDALAQLETLNQSIQYSKEQGIDLVNGFKKSNKMPETKWNHNPDQSEDPDKIYVDSDYLRHSGENYIFLEYNPDIYGYAFCRVSTYPTLYDDPDMSISNPNYIYYDVTVHCFNSGQTCQIVGTGYDPMPSPYRFHGGPSAEVDTAWKFSARVNSCDMEQRRLQLSFSLQKPEPQ